MPRDGEVRLDGDQRAAAVGLLARSTAIAHVLGLRKFLLPILAAKVGLTERRKQ